MQDFLSSLNNRDYVSISIFVIFVIIAFRNEKIKDSMVKIKDIVFKFPFLLIFLLTIFYVLLCLKVLYKYNLWNTFQLKDTILWFIFCAFPQIVNTFHGRMTIKKIVYSTISATALLFLVINFLFNLYSFSLYVELIIAILFYVFYFIIAIYATKNYTLLQKVETFINFLFVVFVIFRAIYILIYQDGMQNMQQTFHTMVLPFVLSVLFLPLPIFFAKYFSVITSYNRLFSISNIFIQNIIIRLFSNVYAVLRLNFWTEAVEVWIFLLPNININSFRDAFTAINKVVSDIKNQNNINCTNKGWPVKNAMKFLEKYGFEASIYKNNSTQWIASAMRYIDARSIIEDSIFYYISGTSSYVNTVAITLTVNLINNSEQQSIDFFLCCASELFSNAISKNKLYQDIEKAIIGKHNIMLEDESGIFLVKCERFESMFTIKFSIERK